MRRLVLLILALATLLPSLAQAYDILLLQSSRNQAYSEVMNGFQSRNRSSDRLIVLSDYAEVDLSRIVREDRPKVILAVGDAALKAARAVRSTPVVAVMALTIDSTNSMSRNISGISMFAAPDRYMEIFGKMKVKRVGVVHNPARSNWYISKAHQAAKRQGIELVDRHITSSKDAISQIDSLTGKIDVLWMIPDTTAVTRETTEAYFHFGQDHSVPVVSFAAGYLSLGAAAAVDTLRFELGMQAHEMANAILEGQATGETVFPARTRISSNKSVLKRFGLVTFDGSDGK